MTPSDVINPFIFLGLLVGSAPPAILLLALNSNYNINAEVSSNEDLTIRMKQAANSEPARVRRSLSENDAPNIRRSKILDTLPHNLAASSSENPDRDDRRFENTDPDSALQYDYESRMDLVDNSRELEWSLRHLDLRQWLYAGVMSSNEGDDEQKAFLNAMLMTWAATVSHLQLFYPSHTPAQKSGKNSNRMVPLGGGRTYTTGPVIRTLQSMCSEADDNYNWYLVTSDRVYVNTDPLKRHLQTMSPAEKIIIGDMSPDGACTSDGPLVLSNAAFRSLCSGLSECVQDGSGMNALTCVEAVTMVTCSTIQEMNVNADLFEANMASTEALLSRHLEVMDQRITQTKQKIAALHSAILKPFTAGSVSMETSDVILSQGSVMLKNPGDFNDTRPSHTTIGEDGTGLRQLCEHVLQQPVLQTGYAAAKRFSDNVYRKTENKTLSATFSFTYAGTDIEKVFEFYYIEPDKRGSDKVTQITVEQLFGSYDVIDSEVNAVQSMTIITILQGVSQANVEQFLTMVDSVCRGVTDLRMTCERTLLLTDQLHEQVKIPLRFENRIGAEMVDVDNPDPILWLQNAGVNHGLVIIVPIKSYFNEEFLKRCQINTKSDQSAYFPIPLKSNKMFQSSSITNEGSENIIWDTSNFEVLCINAVDIMSKAFDRRKEDLYEYLKGLDDFAVSRFVDPGISVPQT